MIFTYQTKGVCSRAMEIELDEEEVIREVRILGGCSGNLQGIRALVLGRPAREVIPLLEGIRCDNKPTSCPDQLSKALAIMLNKQDSIRVPVGEQQA